MLASAPLLTMLLVSPSAQFKTTSQAAKAIALGQDVQAAKTRLLSSGRRGLWALSDLAKKTKGEEKARVVEAMGHFSTEEAEYAVRRALKSRDPVVKRGALLGLGHLGSLRVISPLMKAARSDRWTLAEAAAQSLIELGAPAKKKALSLLSSNRPNARRAALLYIENRGGPSDINRALLIGLQDKNRAVQLDALRLAKAHPGVAKQHLSVLLSLMNNADDAVAVASIEIVGQVPSRRCARALATLVFEPRTQTARWHAALAQLTRSNHDFSVRTLITAALKADPERRRAVIERWKLSADDRTALTLVGGLDATGASARAITRDLLEALGPRAHRAAIVRYVDAEPSLKQAIGRYLLSQPKAQMEPLLSNEAKTNRDLRSRLSAIALLSSMGAGEALLLELSNVQARQIRAAATRALGGISSKRAKEALEAKLKDKAPDVRIAALKGLAKQNLRNEGWSALRSALDDEDAQVRIVAIRLLSGSNDAKTIAQLERRVRDGAYMERVAAIRAIADSTSPKAATLLVNLVTDRNPEIRKAALHVVNDS